MNQFRNPVQVNVIPYRLEGDKVEFLLMKRQPHGGGFWQGVSGGVHPHESLKIAAERELLEETGFKANAVGMEYSFHYPVPTEHQHKYAPDVASIQDHGFIADVSGLGDPTLSSEHSEFKWQALEDINLEKLKWEENQNLYIKAFCYLLDHFPGLALEEEYGDPSRYDCEYGKNIQDIPFFESLLTPSSTSLLDMACGTGRITIPLSKKVLHVVGVDISEEMISLARKKDLEGKIQWVCSDILEMDIGKKFDLVIMGGNSFQAFHEDSDILSLFLAVKRHLSTGGKFCFNTRLFTPSCKQSETEFSPWHEYKDESNKTVKVLGRQIYIESSSITQYQTIRRSSRKVSVSQVFLRYMNIANILTLIEKAELRAVEAYESADRVPLSKNSKTAFIICENSNR